MPLDLDAHRIIRLDGKSVRISRGVAQVLKALAASRSGCASHEYLANRVLREGTDERNALRARICHARHALVCTEYRIETVTDEGYRLRKSDGPTSTQD